MTRCLERVTPFSVINLQTRFFLNKTQGFTNPAHALDFSRLEYQSHGTLANRYPIEPTT